MSIEYDNNGYPLVPIDFTPAARFIAPTDKDTPETLFTSGTTRFAGNTGGRFKRFSDPHQMLIFTDGACLDNGKSSAVGGCAFVFKGGDSPEEVKKGVTSFRLEDRGPSNVAHTHTSNRAELRAVIAALQFRAWFVEGYTELVIATDSEYVVLGATEWVAGWVTRGWRTASNEKVKNMDLWEVLFKEIQRFKLNRTRSLRVLFWRIPRDLNKVADQAAKEAAATEERMEFWSSNRERIESFTKIFGVLV